MKGNTLRELVDSRISPESFASWKIKIIRKAMSGSYLRENLCANLGSSITPFPSITCFHPSRPKSHVQLTLPKHVYPSTQLLLDCFPKRVQYVDPSERCLQTNPCPSMVSGHIYHPLQYLSRQLKLCKRRQQQPSSSHAPWSGRRVASV